MKPLVTPAQLADIDARLAELRRPAGPCPDAVDDLRADLRSMLIGASKHTTIVYADAPEPGHWAGVSVEIETGREVWTCVVIGTFLGSLKVECRRDEAAAWEVRA